MPRRRPRIGLAARCTRRPRGVAVSPCAATTIARPPGSGIGRQSSERQSSRSAEPATPHDSRTGPSGRSGRRHSRSRLAGRSSRARTVDHRPQRRGASPTRCELDRGGRRQAGVRWQGRGDDPAKAGQRQTRFVEGPGGPRRHSRATSRLLAARRRDRSRPCSSWSSRRARRVGRHVGTYAIRISRLIATGSTKPVVVIGVLADEVHSARCADDPDSSRCAAAAGSALMSASTSAPSVPGCQVIGSCPVFRRGTA